MKTSTAVAIALLGALTWAGGFAFGEDAAKPQAVGEAPAKEKSPPAEPKRIVQSKDGAVTLRARDVVIHGKRVRYEIDKDTIGYWTDAKDWVSWELTINQPGQFTVAVDQGCGKDSGGSEYDITVGDQKVSDRVQETGSFATFHVRKLGAIAIDKPGDYTLSVKPTSKPGLAVMDLRTVWLKPVTPADAPKADKGTKDKPAGAVDPSKPEAR